MFTCGKITSRIAIFLNEGRDTQSAVVNGPQRSIDSINGDEKKYALSLRVVRSRLNNDALGIIKLLPTEREKLKSMEKELYDELKRLHEEGIEARKAQRGKLLGGITSVSRDLWNKTKDAARPMAIVTFNSEEKLKKADETVELMRNERQKKEKELAEKTQQKNKLEDELKQAQEALKQAQKISPPSQEQNITTKTSLPSAILPRDDKGEKQQSQSRGVVEMANELSASRAKVEGTQKDIKQSQERRESAEKAINQSQNKLFEILSSLPEDQQAKIVEVLTHGLTPEEQSFLQDGGNSVSPELYVKVYQNFFHYIGESFFDALLKKDNTQSLIYREIQKYLYPDKVNEGELPELTEADIIRLKNDKNAYQIFSQNQDKLQEYATSIGLSEGVFSADITKLSSTISEWYSGNLRKIGSKISEEENTKSLVQAEIENEQNEQVYDEKVQEINGKIIELDNQIQDIGKEISTYAQLENTFDQWQQTRSDTPVTSERISQLSIGEQAPMIISTEDGPVMYYLERKGPNSLQVRFSETCTLTLEGNTAEIQNQLNIIKDIRKIPILSNLITTPFLYHKLLEEFKYQNPGENPFVANGAGIKIFLMQLLIPHALDSVDGKSEEIGMHNFESYINRIKTDIDFRDNLTKNLLRKGIIDPMNGNMKDSIFTHLRTHDIRWPL